MRWVSARKRRNATYPSFTPSDGTKSYFWNARNDLKEIDSPSGAIGQFSYDGARRRVRKSVNGSVTQFLFDGANYIQELDDGPAPALRASILAGPGVDEAFGRTSGT